MSKATRVSSLAAWLARLRFRDLSPRAIHSARRCVLDLLGCAAASRTTSSVVENGTRWATAALAPGTANVWFDAGRMGAPGAAYINALAASALDVDDGHRAASGHPGAAVIPAVLAVAQIISASLDDVVLAIVCGYEAGVGLAAARATSPSVVVATGRWSAVAVAAAVGKLRGLEIEILANAIALAETHAPNMAAADHAGFAGSDSKEGIAWSVLTGIAAVEQAMLGFTGYAGALDNPAVYQSKWNTGRADGFLIESTYFKPYACCRWAHAAIDAVLELRGMGLKPVDVDAIEVATFERAMSLQNRFHPADITAAQFSVPFVVAVALIDGQAALLPMTSALLERSDVIEMARRVVLVPDGSLEACFPVQVPARVTIKTARSAVQREIRTPLGDVDNPLSDLQLVDKAVHLFKGVKSEDKVRTFCTAWLSCEPPAGVAAGAGALFKFLASGAGPSGH